MECELFFGANKVGFHLLRADSGERTVQFGVIEVNGFPVLITELQKGEKTQALSPQLQSHDCNIILSGTFIKRWNKEQRRQIGDKNRPESI